MYKELLAPAGSYESLVAAINAGADAVYAGGDKFGARAFAHNFTSEELKQAIDFVHLHGKKLYLTLNILLKNNEIKEELYDFLNELYIGGLDGVIVQDIGVMSFINKHFKTLPIHASTQMTLTGALGVELLKDFGVSRVVVSRELNFKEINELRERTDLEIEAFIHGALCYCYSGKCLLSSMIGGRSGNRGRCAQPCRMPYNLIDGNKRVNILEEKYLLSLKDLCTLDIIPELIESGINSFKIEGRMKKPEYVAGVVSIYRKYIDKYIDLGNIEYQKYINKNRLEFDNDYRMLMDLYNRGGFTSGYYTTHNSKDMISIERPNHYGVPIGYVENNKAGQVGIRLTSGINNKDVLEIRSGNKTLYEFTIKNREENKSIIYTTTKSNIIKKNQEVFRTKNETLLDELRTKYIIKNKKVKINGILTININQPIELKVIYSNIHNNIHNAIEVSVKGAVAQEAVNQPLTKEKLAIQINRTGNTPFEFDKLDIITKEDTFVTNKELNELRRQALSEIEERIKDIYRRDNITYAQNNKLNKNNQLDKDKERIHTSYQLTVYLEKEEYIECVIDINEIDNIYLDIDAINLKDMYHYSTICHNKNKKLYIVLPHIFRSNSYHWYTKNIDKFINNKADGYVIRNLEEYTFLNEMLIKYNLEFEIIADYMVYTMNNEAKEYWINKGVKHFTAPLELNEKELHECKPLRSDIIIYGYIPLMVTAGCLMTTSKGCSKKEENIYLSDRYNKRFYVKNICNHCYNLIYNGCPIVLLDNKKEVKSLNPLGIRLDFTIEKKEDISNIVYTYINEYIYDNKPPYEINNLINKDFLKKEVSNKGIVRQDFTRGHFKREVVK